MLSYSQMGPTKTSSYPRNSSPYLALFDDLMPERDLFLWNTMIRGYADLGPCQEAIVLYRDMHRIGLLPDSYTFPSVVRSCAVLSALMEGREFINYNVLAEWGDFNSELVFGEMVVRNIVSWTALIAGYVQNGFFEKGLGIFREMVALGTQPNAITLVNILPACAGLEFLNMGKLVHGCAVKLGVDSDISLINTLIALYGKCGIVDTARSLFDQMPVRSLVSWNAMIAAYEQTNVDRYAIKLFRRMLIEKVEFDYITMVSVISACANLGALNTGKWIYKLVRNKDLETNNLVRDAFDKLPHRSVVSWTSIIGACASHGHGDNALTLFTKMKQEGIRPNSFTFISVLTACRHLGLIEEGKKHFESMTKDYSIRPAVEHCACMVDLLGRAGQLVEAYEFIESMPSGPDIGVWGALLGACRIHDVFEYFASIRTPSGEVLMTPGDLMQEIDKDEFKKVMTLMQTHNRQGARHRDGLRIGLKVSSSVEDGGLLEHFFGKDGKQCLEHGKFVQFLRDLHDEILRLEFAHYDYKSQGTISAKDFVLSMIASADMQHVNKFLDRFEGLNDEPNLKDICITFEEFKNLAELRKRLCPLSLAIFSHGKVNGLLAKPNFQRAAYHENFQQLSSHFFSLSNKSCSS
ncbi:unnamed protein product [Camellia sinensis]